MPPPSSANYYYLYGYFQIEILKWKTKALIFASFIIALFLVLLGLFTVYISSELDSQPFMQTLLIEASAGIGIFITAPVVLALGKKNWFPFLSVPASFTSIFLAYHTYGITQSLLIELGIGLLFLTALEIFLRGIISHIENKIRKTEDEISEIENRIDDAESEDAESKFGHGFPASTDEDHYGN